MDVLEETGSVWHGDGGGGPWGSSPNEAYERGFKTAF